jgi:pimeloyl-ACP methyl ester carboxylesterase
MAQRRDFTELLSTIHIPTLVVAGQADAIAPAADAEAWASKIPNASFTVIPNTAHLSPLEDPTTFNQTALKFMGV